LASSKSGAVGKRQRFYEGVVGGAGGGLGVAGLGRRPFDAGGNLIKASVRFNTLQSCFHMPHLRDIAPFIAVRRLANRHVPERGSGLEPEVPLVVRYPDGTTQRGKFSRQDDDGEMPNNSANLLMKAAST